MHSTSVRAVPSNDDRRQRSVFAQVIIDKINEYSLSDTIRGRDTLICIFTNAFGLESVPHTLTGKEFGWEQRRIESPTQLIANVELENMTHPLKAWQFLRLLRRGAANYMERNWQHLTASQYRPLRPSYSPSLNIAPLLCGYGTWCACGVDKS